MKKKKSDPDWRADISAGCVIPGTRIFLIDLLKDDQGQVKEIHLELGTRDIILRFIHCPKDGTFGDIVVWEPEIQTYSNAARTRTKLHPRDKYNSGKGVRMIAKRLLDELSSDRLDCDPKEIYRAIRILIPEEDLRNASGGLVDPNKTYLVRE